MWMRYYLAAGGIHPDKDVNLVTIPPPQMVQNMSIGKMDGFCVGEPWNARAIAEGVGYTAVSTQDMWKDHPEKVCAFTEEFAAKNPRTVKAVLKALHEASVWLDDLGNRPEQAQIVSRATYINCPPEIILEPTPDILAALGAAKRSGQTLVGFAAETEALRENAESKLRRKHLDLIVANDVSAPGAGSEHDTNEVVILGEGIEQNVSLTDKRAVAAAVFDAVVALRARR